jgi:hypothetical protein
MRILELPVGVLTEDNSIKVAVTLERMPASPELNVLDTMYRFVLTMLLNGQKTTVATGPLCLEDLRYVDAAREALSKAIKDASRKLIDDAIEPSLRELSDLVRDMGRRRGGL